MKQGYYTVIAENAANAHIRTIEEAREYRDTLRADWRDIRGGHEVVLTSGFEDGEIIAYLPDPADSACHIVRRVTLTDFAALSAIADSTRCGMRDTREVAA